MKLTDQMACDISIFVRDMKCCDLLTFRSDSFINLLQGKILKEWSLSSVMTWRTQFLNTTNKYWTVNLKRSADFTAIIRCLKSTDHYSCYIQAHAIDILSWHNKSSNHVLNTSTANTVTVTIYSAAEPVTAWYWYSALLFITKQKHFAGQDSS